MGWAALGISVAVAVLAVPAVLGTLTRAGATRQNYRDEHLTWPAGVAVAVAGVVAIGLLAALERLTDADVLPGRVAFWLPYALGVALLGLVDDAFGRSGDADSPRGWRSHARAAAGGSLSTGAVKAVGCLALAAVVLAGVGGSKGDYLLAVLLLVVATNFGNLVDTKPGRSVKALTVLAGASALAGWSSAGLEAVAPWGGAILVVGWLDLRGRTMLGDTGSNLLGAIAGVACVESLGTTGRAVTLAVLLSLTVVGEFRSLGALIERIPLLRGLDSLGRS